MSNIRRKTAEHLTAAWQAPHVTQHDKADVTAVEEFRKAHAAARGSRRRQAHRHGDRHQDRRARHREVPAVRLVGRHGERVDRLQELLPHRRGRGHAERPARAGDSRRRQEDDQRRSRSSLAKLSQKARDKKLSLDEMSGGVFSITNLGGIGGTSFTPIVNQPEVAILGLSRTAIEPRVARRPVRAAADAAAVAVVRPSRHRRRRRGAVPALRRGSASNSPCRCTSESWRPHSS